ncbi:CRISPR-associated endonuclease Cas2 [Desulfococcaceae bacterium HSG8]|nr:CRISPR-associated endonuclease Cas2 [Desulfococcaceae bacterium HSG8]
MKRKAWYLVCYDIANPKRLKKIHRLMKKRGIAAQKSVFFVRGTESQINGLLDEAAELMALDEDDLRAYPVLDPKKVWAFGPNPMAEFPAARPASGERKKVTGQAKKSESRWRQILQINCKS